MSVIQDNITSKGLLLLLLKVSHMMIIGISVQWNLDHEPVNKFTHIQNTQENSLLWGSMNITEL